MHSSITSIRGAKNQEPLPLHVNDPLSLPVNQIVRQTARHAANIKGKSENRIWTVIKGLKGTSHLVRIYPNFIHKLPKMKQHPRQAETDQAAIMSSAKTKGKVHSCRWQSFPQSSFGPDVPT